MNLYTYKSINNWHEDPNEKIIIVAAKTKKKATSIASEFCKKGLFSKLTHIEFVCAIKAISIKKERIVYAEE